MDELLRSKAQCDVNNYMTVLYIFGTTDKNPIVRGKSQKAKVISVYRKSYSGSAEKKRGYKQCDPSLICTCLLSLCIAVIIL
jgi:hypothetical protein